MSRLHKDNEVEFDHRQFLRPQWIICDGCQKLERAAGTWKLPAGWVVDFAVTPARHYCPLCITPRTGD